MVEIKFSLEAFPLTNENREKVEQELNELFKPIKPIVWHRICDECRQNIDLETTKTIFECKECNLKFDLCEKCQSFAEKDKCPTGSGCSDIPCNECGSPDIFFECEICNIVLCEKCLSYLNHKCS